MPNGFSTSEEPQELVHLRLSNPERQRNQATTLGAATTLGY